MSLEDSLQKLRYVKGLRSTLINAPKNIQEEFDNLNLTSSIDLSDKYQFTLLFVRNKADVDKLVKSTIDNIKHDSIFWISYPKGGSSIKTDINRDKLWELMKPFGYRPVSQVAIDKDWAAMRFRPTEKVGSKL
jgi:hypothetical protein